MIPIFTSVAALKERYDVWFCDIWGVMHNGETAFDEAIAACRRFRSLGGHVVLITNAPRPYWSVQEQLEFFGVPGDAYCAIVSSGDVTDHLIKTFAGQAIFHLGPARDAPIIERAKIKPVALDEADLVLHTGLLDDDVETPDDYRSVLSTMLERGVPMICANPDLKVERGDRLVYCAGAVAAVYEEMGGTVHYAGKLFPPIYELAKQQASHLMNSSPQASRIVCIGDGLLTDMEGAFRAGIDALFVASQLHVNGGLTDEMLSTLFAQASGRPIGAIDALRW